MAHGSDVIIERDSEGYYVASVPALPGCHTQARSLNNLARFRDGEPSRDSMFAVARTNARRPGITKSRLAGGYWPTHT